MPPRLRSREEAFPNNSSSRFSSTNIFPFAHYELTDGRTSEPHSFRVDSFESYGVDPKRGLAKMS